MKEKTKWYKVLGVIIICSIICSLALCGLVCLVGDIVEIPKNSPIEVMSGRSLEDRFESLKDRVQVLEDTPTHTKYELIVDTIKLPKGEIVEWVRYINDVSYNNYCQHFDDLCFQNYCYHSCFTREEISNTKFFKPCKQ